MAQRAKEAMARMKGREPTSVLTDVRSDARWARLSSRAE